MRAGSLQWRTLAATLALVCSATALIAQEAPDNPRQAREKASALAAQQNQQNDSEIAALRGEIRALRRDVTRLLVLLESRSTANPAAGESTNSERKPSTASHADKGRSAAESGIYPVTYNTADLVMPISKTATPASSKTDKNEPAERIEPDFDSLIEFIQSRVRPESWDINGGPGSILKYANNLALVISQTQKVHEEIAASLAALRKAVDRQIVLETKIMTFDKEPAGQIAKLDGKAGVLTAPRAKLLTEIAHEDRRANIYQTPKVTLFSGQTANLRLDDSPAGAVDLLINAVLNEDRHSVRLRVAVNAKDESDVLRSNDSLDVAEGQSVLIDLSAKGLVLIDIPSAGTSSRTFYGRIGFGRGEPIESPKPGVIDMSHTLQPGKRLLMVTPRIIVAEEDKELLGIPTRP